MTFTGATSATIDLGAEIAAEPILALLMGLAIVSMLTAGVFHGIVWLRNPNYHKSEAFQRRRNDPATPKNIMNMWNHR